MQGIFNLTSVELAALGYTDLSLISKTESFRIYRALTHDDQSVLIRVPASGRPPMQLIPQLEHEFEIACDLNPEHVVRPVKIERSADQTALILEECSYPPLTELLQAPLEMETFFPIATGIAAASRLRPAPICATRGIATRNGARTPKSGGSTHCNPGLWKKYPHNAAPSPPAQSNWM